MTTTQGPPTDTDHLADLHPVWCKDVDNQSGHKRHTPDEPHQSWESTVDLLGLSATVFQVGVAAYSQPHPDDSRAHVRLNVWDKETIDRLTTCLSDADLVRLAELIARARRDLAFAIECDSQRYVR